MNARRKIRWLIAHYPVYLFERTAKKFADELEVLCPGQFDIEIHTVDTYVEQYNDLNEMTLLPPDIRGLEGAKGNRKLSTYKDVKTKWDAVFNGLKEGKFELSQTQVSIIGHYLHSNFNALDLPFLFNGHDHVSDVLDGEIGDSLCEDLSATTDIKGLAFTYSGGYRVIGATHGITNLTDLAKTNFMTSTTPSTVLFEELGMTPIPKGLAEVSDFGDLASEGGAIETTYLRFTGKHILKTDHSIFMTTILTGNGFWDTLTLEQQQAFKIAAKQVAKTERIWSVEDAEKYEQQAKSKGISIVELSNEDKIKLKQAARASAVYTPGMKIDPKLVARIVKAGK